MNIPEAISRALTRRAAGTGHGATARTLAELERAAGSKKAAAQAAGVSPETWRRWRNGSQHPSKGHLEGLEAAVRRSRLRPGRESRLRSQKPAMRITGHFQYSSDSRERTIDLAKARVLHPGFMDDLIDAYLNGDEERQAQLIEGILDEYVPGLHMAEHLSNVEIYIGTTGAYGDDE